MEADTLGNDVDLSCFDSLGEIVKYAATSPAENAVRIKDADVVVANKIQMNEELLKDCTNLKLICLTATGTNNIDFEYTAKRGIAVAFKLLSSSFWIWSLFEKSLSLFA